MSPLAVFWHLVHRERIPFCPNRNGYNNAEGLYQCCFFIGENGRKRGGGLGKIVLNSISLLHTQFKTQVHPKTANQQILIVCSSFHVQNCFLYTSLAKTLHKLCFGDKAVMTSTEFYNFKLKFELLIKEKKLQQQKKNTKTSITGNNTHRKTTLRRTKIRTQANTT